MLPELQAAARDWQRVTDYLVSFARAVEPNEWSEPSSYPDWSNKDLLAHIAAGYVVRIAHLESIIASGEPAPRVDIDSVNAERIAARRDASVDGLIAELRDTRGRVLELMERLRPDHLSVELERSGPPPWTQPLRDFLTRELSSHDLEHAEDLRNTTGVIVEAPEPDR